MTHTANAAQAKLLLDPALPPLIWLLMEEARGAAEVARLLGLDFKRAHYLLRKLEAAGVAEVAEVQPRAGRAVKRYRVPGPWFVPFEVTGAQDLQAFLEAQMMPRMHLFLVRTVEELRRVGDQWGYFVQADPFAFNLTDSQGKSPFDAPGLVMAHWGVARLAPEHAAEFRARMLALVEEFSERAPEDAPEHSVGLFCVRGNVQTS